MSKFIVVEGKSDKKRLQAILAEPVEILCTQGTLRYEQLEEWAELLADEEVYSLFDADDSGDKLRGQLKHMLPRVRHLKTQRQFREVAATPIEILKDILERAHFIITI